MRASGDVARDFVEMQLHGFCVGLWQRERRALAAGRADRAEQIGVFIALIGRLSGPRSAPRPLPYKPVLLADTGFILKPNFDRRRVGQTVEMGVQRAWEVFLKASMISAFCPGWRGRALICEKPSVFNNVPT
jgi:hypothetical protein